MWQTLAAVLILASVIAGEAPGCPFEAKLAVAHVYHNRIEQGIEGGWFGKALPTPDDLDAARYYWMHPDPTDGALYLIGPGDREKMPWLRERVRRFECAGTWLEAWK